ncbi:MAG: uncharacterized protein QOF76_694, partial [Solirubrobacteraceae bacterium]|nr:uncharacterized protein [Solirubrobacteraceae bacterium]
CPAAAGAAELPPGAAWTQATITSGDGTKLHADILRPKDLPASAKLPVILSVGPYFNHSGQTGPEGSVEGTSYDPVGPVTAPSDRFYDFIEGAHLMERGYAFVMVDLRGFGGSGGCLDWGGPGEQSDVVAAVKWAASQPWSTGHVGMYGKSYDAVTGLVGEISNPTGLDAVVAQEPVYDLYRYLYSNGVRFANALGTPASYDAIALTPGPLLDDPSYLLGGLTSPVCLASNLLSQQDANHGSAYWKARNLIARAPEGKVPLFMTQGFLEDNTKPDGAWNFFNAVDAPKRGWFGMWDHVRGNDRDMSHPPRLAMGRAGFFDETMRFFDHYVRGVSLADAATDKDPPVAVETSDGTWRSEASWPPADATPITTDLKTGTYNDDGNVSGTGEGAASEGVWTISPPLAGDAWYAGVPQVKLDLGTAAQAANVVVDTYDIDAGRKATLLSRNASLVPAGGGQVTMDLYGNDWRMPAGHRVGVLVTSSNSEWWLHSPSGADVTVKSGTIALPFLRHLRPDTIEGGPSIRLDAWKKDAPFVLEQSVVDAGTAPGFGVPGAMTAAPAPEEEPHRSHGRGNRLRVRIAHTKRLVSVYGNAPAKSTLVIRLRRNGRVVRRARATTHVSAFRVRFRVQRPGRYSATVVLRSGSTVLSRAHSRRMRVA